MARQLAGMTVVITGASAGIGASLARNLAARGARLVIAARRVDRLNALAAELGPSQVTAIRADVAVEQDCQSLIEESARILGRIDTLVCNAGYGVLRDIAGTTHDEMQSLFATNVLGTTDCVRYAVPIMIRQQLRDDWRGQIMIVTSAVARRGLPYFGGYSATKFAQLGIAEALRLELRRHRVAVSTVHPVSTETEFFTTAEQHGGSKMPKRAAFEVVQSAATVATKMARAIQRPRPEVWPFRPARIMLGLAALMPRLTDLAMGGVTKSFEHLGPDRSADPSPAPSHTATERG